MRERDDFVLQFLSPQLRLAQLHEGVFDIFGGMQNRLPILRECFRVASPRVRDFRVDFAEVEDPPAKCAGANWLERAPCEQVIRA